MPRLQPFVRTICKQNDNNHKNNNNKNSHHHHKDNRVAPNLVSTAVR